MLYNKYLSVRSLVEVFQFCCQSCDIIFLPKTVEIEKQKKHTIVWSTKFYHSVNFGLKKIKTVKVVPWLQLRDPKVTSADPV